MPRATCNICGESWDREPALAVPCPDCKAPVNRRCVRPSGHECSVHRARDQLAMDEGFLKPCPGPPQAPPPPAAPVKTGQKSLF